MIEHIMEQTDLYINRMPKKERKRYGQFFTSNQTAMYMAELFVIADNKDTLTVLDAGAGSGILSCALVEVIQKNTNVKSINLTCYETDKKIIGLLRNNLNFVKQNADMEFDYEIITDNYITSQYMDFNQMLGGNPDPKKFDLVIGNPPYMKIPKDAPEATAMPEICYGAPNLYFLFAAMGLFNLKHGGEMVYIIPRSWTSGAYFKKFRNYLLTESKLEQIHLFVSRNKVFVKEDVLQETMIIKVHKTHEKPKEVVVTTSKTNNDFEHISEIRVPYDMVVSGVDKYVYLVTDEVEVEVLKKLNRWNHTLPEIGLKMKTGLTVDFRNRDILRNEFEAGAIPLFYSQHIQDGIVKFPIKKEHEYLVTDQNGLRQKNKNYLFVKRFTAKEERRRLQCGVYLSKKYPQYEAISTQNKINFIDGLTTELSECVVYGLYVLFNSTIYDVYYRILNGSTQVNSSEINAMPVPELGIIQEIGRKIIRTKDLSESNCDRILEEYCG